MAAGLPTPLERSLVPSLGSPGDHRRHRHRNLIQISRKSRSSGNLRVIPGHRRAHDGLLIYQADQDIRLSLRAFLVNEGDCAPVVAGLKHLPRAAPELLTAQSRGRGL